MTGIFASVSVLVVGWQLGAGTGVTATTATASASTKAAAGTSTPTPSVTSSPAGTSPTLKSGSFTGTSVATRFGNVQVQLVVRSGKITDVVALQLTDKERKSVQISNEAAPILRAEVLDSQSAQVDSVGGATYTSDAYLSSLQAALDLAKA